VTKGYVRVTYKSHVIASVSTDILDNVPVDHPFRDHGEPSILEGVRNSNKTMDVRMGKVLPQCDFFAGAL